MTEVRAICPHGVSLKRRRLRPITSFAVAAVAALLAGGSPQAAASSSIVQQKMFGLPTGLAYYIEVTVGSPLYATGRGTQFNLLVDTGSSNTAVVTADCCSSTSTSLYSCSSSSTCVDQAKTVSVSYVTGSWSGELVHDTFSSAELGVVPAMPFVEILQESNFIQSGYDGIVGLAYPSIASPSGSAPTPYFETLQAANALPDVISTLMCGALQSLLIKDASYDDDFYAGELIMGGTTGANDTVYHQGDLVYTPLVQEKWYNVLATGIKVGDDQLDVSCKDINTPRTIIDSGTSNIAFPSAVYSAIVNDLQTKVQKIIPGIGDSFFSDSVPCCSSYCDPTKKNTKIFDLPSLTISLALDDGGSSGQQISITIPPEYIWRPLMVYSTYGVQKCRVFGISEGDLTLLGDVFMDGLFTVHDRESQRLGFGVAESCPNGVNSTKTVTVEKLNSTSSYCDCVSSSDQKKSLVASYLPFSSKPCFFWIWWMYVVIASIVVIFVSLCVVAYVFFQRRKFRREAQRAHLERQQSNALDRNLLTPQCDAGTPPPMSSRTTQQTTTSFFGASSGGGAQRPSNLTASTASSARPSEVHIEMRPVRTPIV